jgi:hypothetical protein
MPFFFSCHFGRKWIEQIDLPQLKSLERMLSSFLLCTLSWTYSYNTVNILISYDLNPSIRLRTYMYFGRVTRRKCNHVHQNDHSTHVEPILLGEQRAVRFLHPSCSTQKKRLRVLRSTKYKKCSERVQDYSFHGNFKCGW